MASHQMENTNPNSTVLDGVPQDTSEEFIKNHTEKFIQHLKSNNEGIKVADVLIVCGQGTYKDGRFWTEYPDRDVYLEHAIEIRNYAKRYAYNVIVLCGGHTNPEDFALTEAGSVVRIWEDTNSAPGDEFLVVMDPYSLDSSENIHLGLMCVRQKLKELSLNIPIRRIGVFSSWAFKKKRFDRVAEELGIIEYFYFHGLAEAPRAEVGEKAVEGEKKWFEEAEPRDPKTKAVIEDKKDYLMIRIGRTKRWERFTGNAKSGTQPNGAVTFQNFLTRASQYNNRLQPLRPLFPNMFVAFECLRRLRDRDTTGMLKNAMKDEVICPPPVP